MFAGYGFCLMTREIKKPARPDSDWQRQPGSRNQWLNVPQVIAGIRLCAKLNLLTNEVAFVFRLLEQPSFG